MTTTNPTAAELAVMIAEERAAWQAVADAQVAVDAAAAAERETVDRRVAAARAVSEALGAARPRDPVAMAVLLRWLADPEGGNATNMDPDELNPLLEHVATRLEAMDQR